MPDKDQRKPAEVVEDTKDTTEDETKVEDTQPEDGEGEDKSKSETKDKDGKTKTISTKEYNKLKAIERKAKKKIEKGSSDEPSDGRFSFDEPEETEQPTESEISRQDREEFGKVVVGVVQLQIDNDDVRNLVKDDKSLARILKKNPLMLLDETPIDGEDALEQISEYLVARAEEESDEDDDKGSDGEKKKKSTKPVTQKPKVEEKKEEKKDSFSVNSTQKKVEGSILDKMS